MPFLAKKGFQGQKQWPQKFHIKFRKNKSYLTPSLLNPIKPLTLLNPFILVTKSVPDVPRHSDLSDKLITFMIKKGLQFVPISIWRTFLEHFFFFF